MTRDTQHALETLRPAAGIRECTNSTCGLRRRAGTDEFYRIKAAPAVAVIDGRALCASHGSAEFAVSLRDYIGPGVMPSDARP